MTDFMIVRLLFDLRKCLAEFFGRRVSKVKMMDFVVYFE